MSSLTLYDDSRPDTPVLETRERERITEELSKIGVRFELWRAGVALSDGADQAAVLEAYGRDVKRLMEEGGYRASDVVRMNPAHPDRAALRAKFLQEHIHGEDEVRFFVEGAGAFYLHEGGKVFRVVCERGDLISVPAGITHWFDAGERPSFCAIRLFTNPEGWVAKYTGDEIASRFPPYQN